MGRQIRPEDHPGSVIPQRLHRDGAPGIDMAHEEKKEGVVHCLPPRHDRSPGGIQGEHFPLIVLDLPARDRKDVPRREGKCIHARRARERIPGVPGIGNRKTVRPGRAILGLRGKGQGGHEDEKTESERDR